MDILNELISINTTEDKENAKIRTYLKNYLSPLNFSFEEIGDKEKKVLLAKRGDPNIAFICHTDTVAPSEQWTKDPYQLTEEEGFLYGLGISDMKGGISAALEAIKSLPIENACLFIFTYDEEINFTGIKQLVEKNIPLPSYLIFTEPTDGYPVIANKGCLEFEFKVTGKSAHSSTPELGENALYKAMECITEIREFANKISKEKNYLYELESTSFNLSKITGGEEINKVPDKCYFTFDFRTIKKEHNVEIKQEIQKIGDKYQAQITVLNDLNAALNQNREMITWLEQETKKKTLGLNYGTEASFFPNKDICILGPGPVTAHQKDEHITKKSYNEVKELYTKMILEQNKK